jgi:hypothetical protein
MDDLKQALKDFVATSNSGKYSDFNTLMSKFPELSGLDANALKDFVATSNSGKYQSEKELFGKFPEFVKKKEESALQLESDGISLDTPKKAPQKPSESSPTRKVKNPSSFNKNIESSDYQRHTKLASVAIEAAKKKDATTVSNTLKEMNSIRAMYPEGVFESDKQMSDDVRVVAEMAKRNKLGIYTPTGAILPSQEPEPRINLPKGITAKSSDIKYTPDEMKKIISADMIELEAIDFDEADRIAEEEFSKNGIEDKVLNTINNWTIRAGMGYLPSSTDRAIAKAANELKSTNPNATPEEVLKYAKEQRKKEIVEVQKDRAIEDYFDGKSVFTRPEEQIAIESALQGVKSKQEYHIARFNEKQNLIESNLALLESYKTKADNGEALTSEEVTSAKRAMNDVNLLYTDLERNYKNIESDAENLKGTDEELDRFKRNYAYITNTGAKLGAASLRIIGGFADLADMVGSGGEANTMTALENPFGWGAVGNASETMSNVLLDSVSKKENLKNVKSIGDFAEWAGELMVDQAPQLVMAYTTGGLAIPLMGSSAAGQEFRELKDNKDYSSGQKVAASLAVGLAESLSEKLELDVMRTAFPSSRMARAATRTKTDADIFKESLRTGIKGSVIKSIEKLGVAGSMANKEGISELVAQLGNNITDKYILDKKDVSILDGVSDAYLSGAVIGGAIMAAPAIATKVISPFVYDPEKKVSKNVVKLGELSRALEIATKDSDKVIIQSQIDKINGENFAIVDAAINRTKKLSPDEIREGVSAIERMQEIKTQLSEINNSEQYTPDQKAVIIEGLRQEYNELVLKRKALIDKADATVAEATSEATVQQEVGVGEEVAQEEFKTGVKVATEESVKEGTKEVVSGVEITYPSEQQKQERKESRNRPEYVEEASKELQEEDVDVLSEELSGEFGILTAENPMAQPLTEEENKQLNQKAEEWLSSKGYKPKRVTGKYDQAENSFFVPGLTVEDAIEFAKEFNQESVAHSTGLVKQDGSMNPRMNSDDNFSFEDFTPESNYVSVVKTKDGLKTFQIGYDFNTTVDSNKPAAQSAQQVVAQPIKETDENYQESRDAVMQIAEGQDEFIPGDAVLDSVVKDSNGAIVGGTISYLDSNQEQTTKNISREQKESVAKERKPQASNKVEIIENVKKAIAKVFPKLNSQSFKDAKSMREYARKEYGDAVADQIQDNDAARVLLDENNMPIAILVNEKLSDETTFPHEVWHPILLKAFGENQKLFGEFRDSIRKALVDNGYKDIAEQLDAFADQQEYADEGVSAEEWLVQFGGMLTSSGIDVKRLNKKQKSLLGQLKDIINKFATRISGQPVFLEDATPETILDFMTSLSDMMARGEDISGVFKEGVGKATEVKSRSQKAAIEILDGPKFDNKLKEDVASYLNGLRDSEIPPNSSREQLMERFINNVYEEVGYYLFSKPDARSAGLTWYIEDMVEFENKVKVIVPELSNEKQYKLFLSILAFTSSGTNPNMNLSYAYNLWNNSNDPKNFDFSKDWGEKKLSFIDKKGKAIASGVIVKETAKEYTVELVDSLGKPEVDRNGNKKYEKISKASMKAGYPKPTGYTNRGKIIVGQLEKLENLYSDLKSIDAVVEWLETPHPIAELRKYNEAVPDVNGKGPGKTNKKYDPSKNADGERNGAFIFGEKIGSFYQNMIGIGETITMDLWWSRTWNRYMGTMINTTSGNKEIQEVPRSDRERNIMREAVKMVAEDLNLQVSELQAAIWYFEQELWTKSGNASPSYSYVTAIDELTEKLKVDEETRTKLRAAEADLTEAERRRKNAAERAAVVVASKGGEIPKVEVTTKAQKSQVEATDRDFVLPFGKHQGKWFTTTPPAYRDWLTAQPWFDIRKYLKPKEETVVSTKAQKAPANVPNSVFKYLTEDDKGNIVFHHYSRARRNEIKPSTGSGSLFTSKEEAQAMGSVGGLAMYYTQVGQKENGVGNEEHTVLVPKEKVYYMNTDPLNLYDEAKSRFLDYMNRGNKVQIEYAFSPNYQTAWITKVAQEKGFDMVISKWKNDADFRAQSTIPLKPTKDNIKLKVTEDNIEVGDKVFVRGRPAIITEIDADGIATYKSKDSSGKFDIPYSERSMRYGTITLLEKGPFEMDEDMEIVSKTRAQKSPQDRMADELQGVIDKLRQRGATKARLYKGALAYLQGSSVYENADDIEREQMVRDLRSDLGMSERSAPRIFSLKRKDNKITVSERQALRDQIRLEAKAAKGAIQARQKIAVMIKDQLSGLFKKGIIKTSQMQAINKKLLQLNFFNQDHVDNFINYMDRVFRNAEYADKLTQANSLHTKIKRAIKDKTIQAETRDTAKEFLKLAPYMIEDIDRYLEIANEVYEAVQQTKGTVVEGIAEVSFKKAMDYGRVQEYTKLEKEAQEEVRKQRLLEKNQYLVESGVLDENMSLKEMMSIIESIESDPESEVAKDKERIIRDYVNRYFDSYRTILEEIVRTDIDPFTGERMYLSAEQRSQISKFINVDLNVLSLKEAYHMVNAVDNFIVNQNMDGMQATIKAYQGIKNAKQAEKEGIVSRPLRAYWSKRLGRFWGEQFEQITMMHERMFGGVRKAMRFDRLSGLSDLLTDKVVALKKHNAVIEKYSDRFGDVKDFSKAENVFERGILGIVARNVQGSEVEQQEEFNKQKKNIQISIDTMKQGTDKQQNEAVIAQQVYDEILKDANSYEEAKANSKDFNVAAVEFWQNEFAEIFDELQDVSRGVYNTILDRDINYLPHTYKRFEKKGEGIEVSGDGSAFFDINEGFDTRETGVLMKATKPKLTETGIPSRILNFDFDSNMSRAIQGAFIDISTASTIRQISSFYGSNEFAKIVPNKEDRDLARDRMRKFIKRVKKKNYVQEDNFDVLAKSANYISSFSASRALGSLAQIPKQTISVAANTMMNAGGNLSMIDVFKAKDFIDKSGYGVSIRGIASQADIQTINQILKKAEDSKGKQALDYLKKMNDLYLELFVAQPDVFIARASWITYYKKKLKALGEDTNDIDWDTHELNTEAADYAQRMVDRQQNFSDADLAGEFMSNKKPIVQLLRKSLFPFASFGINKKAQIIGDMSVLYNKTASKDDRKAAITSLASWGVEQAVFSAVSIFIGNVLYNFISNLMADYDEEDEEVKKSKLKAVQYRTKNMVVEVLSPIPNIADEAVTNSINYVLETLKIDETYRLPESKGEKLYEKVGLTNIMSKKVANLRRMTYAGATGTYVDAFGNEKVMSEEDQKRVASMAAVYSFYVAGLVPADIGMTIDNAYYKIGKKSTSSKAKSSNPFGSFDTKFK